MRPLRLGTEQTARKLRRLRTPADSFRGSRDPTGRATDQLRFRPPSPMRQILASAFVVAVSCGPTTPSAQISPTSRAASPSPLAPAYRNWIEEPGARLAASDLGQPATYGVADTDIAQLPDGRLRLYHLGHAGSAQPSLLSAISSDGLHFTPEPGTRCNLFACIGGQPGLVALPDGGWRLYFNHPDGFYSAVTQDGLTFTADPGVRLRFADFPVRPGMEVTGAHVTKAKEGGWRMYFSERFAGIPQPGPRPRVFSAHSADLLSWTPDPGMRVPDAIRPFVLQLGDGSYQMFAVNMAQPTGIGGCTCIETATSVDGLAWSTMQPTGLEGGDPSAYVMSDGQIRLYYNDGDFYPSPHDDRIFSANLASLPWGVEIDRAPSTPGGTMIERTHATVRVVGAGPAVTVRVVDRTRQLVQSVVGLPLTEQPPFKTEFDIQPPPQVHADELIEVMDSNGIRLFEVLSDSSQEPRP